MTGTELPSRPGCCRKNGTGNPLPLSNVVPALLIAVIATAYFEEDGLILLLAMLAAAAVLVVDLRGGWLLIQTHLS
jgi:hypothetical protein